MSDSLQHTFREIKQILHLSLHRRLSLSEYTDLQVQSFALVWTRQYQYDECSMSFTGGCDIKEFLPLSL